MKVLFVNACISDKDYSRTLRLAEAYLKRFDKDNIVIEDLVKKPYLPKTSETLCNRNKAIENNHLDDEMFLAAKRFSVADEIVIAAPYWDLSFPSELKVFIEHIMVNNITFTYRDNKPVGLCKAKRIIYITTSGGYILNNNLGFDYIFAIGKMLGIKECFEISAEGLDIEGADVELILSNKISEIMEDNYENK